MSYVGALGKLGAIDLYNLKLHYGEADGSESRYKLDISSLEKVVTVEDILKLDGVENIINNLGGIDKNEAIFLKKFSDLFENIGNHLSPEDKKSIAEMALTLNYEDTSIEDIKETTQYLDKTLKEIQRNR